MGSYLIEICRRRAHELFLMGHYSESPGNIEHKKIGGGGGAPLHVLYGFFTPPPTPPPPRPLTLTHTFLHSVPSQVNEESQTQIIYSNDHHNISLGMRDHTIHINTYVDHAGPSMEQLWMHVQQGLIKIDTHMLVQTKSHAIGEDSTSKWYLTH